MTDVPFDTMATARFLRESGIEERQAAAITAATKDGVTGGVATKAGFARLEVKIKAELNWIKVIGGAILAVPMLSWLAELILAALPA